MKTLRYMHAFVLDWLSCCFLGWSQTQTYACLKSTSGHGIAHPFIQALDTIFLLYVTPETSDNLELRQCLSYFFPVYCYSNTENQRKVKEVS